MIHLTLIEKDVIYFPNTKSYNPRIIALSVTRRRGEQKIKICTGHMYTCYFFSPRDDRWDKNAGMKHRDCNRREINKSSTRFGDLRPPAKKAARTTSCFTRLNEDVYTRPAADRDNEDLRTKVSSETLLASTRMYSRGTQSRKTNSEKRLR